MKANVKDIIHSSIAAFHSEGLQLFVILEEAYKKNSQIEVSFDGIDRCATQFLNASIGKMYMLYNPEKLDGIIIYDYADIPSLPQKINEVKENAINANNYDRFVADATA